MIVAIHCIAVNQIRMIVPKPGFLGFNYATIQNYNEYK